MATVRAFAADRDTRGIKAERGAVRPTSIRVFESRSSFTEVVLGQN
jgi:hypothetical protein